MAKSAFEGVKVLEYAQFVSGPYCAKLFADLGAEVIKIEEPGSGDKARTRGPYPGDAPHAERSALFLYLNTNKKGITLDPKNEDGKKIFLDLVRWADILIEDNSPKVMEELGLTYETLKEINPKLILTSITPFGQTGLYRDYKAHPLNVIHGAGGGYLTPGDSPNLEREPLKSGGYLDEGAVGLSAAFAAGCALFSRWFTGSGQHVDVSKQEVVMNLDRVEIDGYPNQGIIASRSPKTSGKIALGVNACKDGYIMAFAMDDRQWEGMLTLMGNPEWSKDEKFKDPMTRAQNSADMMGHMSEWLMQHDRNEIYHKAQPLLWPVAPIYSIEEVVNWPQAQARDFFVEIDHPEAGKLVYPSAPYKFSETPCSWEQPAPLLGQHNEEVYRGMLGLSEHELSKLKKAGVI